MDSAIRLFKSVLVSKVGKKAASKELLQETVKHGFIFAPEVIHNYSERDLFDFIKIIEKEFGLTGEQLNASFHKSWRKVRDASIEQLVVEQLFHYFTTYGAESLGIYDKDLVYVPTEKLSIPKIKLDKIPLVVIKGITRSDLKERLFSLLSSGVALKEDTKRDVIDVATFLGINESEVTNIANKEVKCALYDYLNILPEEPVEFLRFAIYKAINKTLLIKDRLTIQEIKTKDNLAVLGLFEKYSSKYGLEKLSEIFYRFKPIFLAFRKNKKMKIITNKIRKLAYKYHKPMKEDYLNSVTANISYISGKQLKSELDKVNTFRKIRLAYALKFRTANPDSILYRIRNGKSWATNFQAYTSSKFPARWQEILDIVYKSIVDDIKPNVKGKKIYIPSNITYALPATEKQFTGDLPSGTCVSVPKDIIFGVHWENVEDNRIDLDLSLIDQKGDKLGWDSGYRNNIRSILFSGDITDAPKPNGASELFYVGKALKVSAIMFVNYYNCDEDVEVPFKIVVASKPVSVFDRNYMVDPNSVIAISKSKIKERQKVLGLLVADSNGCKLYFTETQLGCSITSYDSDYSNNARKYLVDYYSNSISLNDVLKDAGAKVTDKPVWGDKGKEQYICDIDLRPEKISKDTILSLLTKVEEK